MHIVLICKYFKSTIAAIVISTAGDVMYIYIYAAYICMYHVQPHRSLGDKAARVVRVLELPIWFTDSALKNIQGDAARRE